MFVSATQSSTQGNLLVGEMATYVTSATISATSEGAAFIANSAVVTATTPKGAVTSDTSDDGDNTDGDTEGDPTEVDLVRDPKIVVSKSASVTTDNGDGFVGPGDTITYSITISNTGNLSLSSITLSDTLVDALGNVLTLASGPTFVSGTLSSTAGSIKVGEEIYYTATYVIEQGAANSGAVSNSLYVIASSPGESNNVTDTSDDPNTGAANDATVVNITPIPGIEVTKLVTVIENGDGSLGIGDTVKYTISIENKGNVDLTSLVISDTFVDMASSTLALTTTPTFDFADLGSSAVSYTHLTLPTKA